MRCRFLFLLPALAAAFAAPALAIETKAQYAYLIDDDTGTVLYAKQADAPMHPSSMSKLMTTYVLYQRIKQGRIKLDDKFLVSEKAWRMQGSKMFVHVGDEVPVDELLKGIVIQSGNDACIVVAEGVSGSEEEFAKEMTRVGKEIGLTNSNFVNATGMPDDGQIMSSRDLATLAHHIIHDFPEHYHYYSEREFTYNNIRQPNRNRLLDSKLGVDGLKTGHTDIAGYGITLSAKDAASGRRLILVINGLASDNERVEEGDKLLRYGFREFEQKTLLSQGQVVEQAPVWYGEAETVPLVAQQEVKVTLPIHAEGVQYSIHYDSPIPAPIAKGARLATLSITLPGAEPMQVPLVAGEDVAKLSGFGRLWANLRHLLLHGK